MEIGSLLLSTIGKIKVSQVFFLPNGKLMFLFLTLVDIEAQDMEIEEQQYI
jgi:hypothetical protein